MSKLLETSDTTTINVDNIAMSGAGVVGAIIAPTTPVNFADADTGSTTPLDGIVIPMIDRDMIDGLPVSNPIQITSASADTSQGKIGRPQRFVLNLSAAPDLKPKHTISVGNFTTPTYVGRFEITSMPTPQTIVVQTKDESITAGSFVNEFIWGVTRQSGCVSIGFVSMSLGSGVAGANVRAALVYTDDPASGATYATRLAANEVTWSKVYPIGSVVNIEFPGLQHRTGDDEGWTPPKAATAPATGYEHRLMLVLYWESGTPVAFTLDADITHTTNTLTETTVR